MQHQAEAMRKRRQSEDGDVVVGTIVSLQVSEFDRPKLMSPNMTLVVVDVRDSGHGYMLGNEHGFLKTVYTRSQFTVLKSLGPSLLGMGDACGAYARGELSSMIPRELVAKSSPVGKHGIQTRCGSWFSQSYFTQKGIWRRDRGLLQNCPIIFPALPPVQRHGRPGGIGPGAI